MSETLELTAEDFKHLEDKYAEALQELKSNQELINRLENDCDVLQESNYKLQEEIDRLRNGNPPSVLEIRTGQRIKSIEAFFWKEDE